MASVGTSARAVIPVSRAGNGQTYRGLLTIMTILFFMWGFMIDFYGLKGHGAGRGSRQPDTPP